MQITCSFPEKVRFLSQVGEYNGKDATLIQKGRDNYSMCNPLYQSSPYLYCLVSVVVPKKNRTMKASIFSVFSWATSKAVASLEPYPAERRTPAAWQGWLSW